jgi:hypothetical protein
VKPLYANDEYVGLSETVSLQRSNIFEIGFRHSTNGVICNFKFVFVTKSDGPFRVYGQRSYTYKCITPSCEVSLERSFIGLFNDI